MPISSRFLVESLRGTKSMWKDNSSIIFTVLSNTKESETMQEIFCHLDICHFDKICVGANELVNHIGSLKNVLLYVLVTSKNKTQWTVKAYVNLLLYS